MKDIRLKDINTVRAFREDLVLAANRLCGMNIPWWQRYWMKGCNESSIAFLLASRGSGKTVFLALYCVLRALLFPKERVGIVSNSYRQAQITFGYVIDRIEESPHIIASLSKKPTVGLHECSVFFKNGSSIRALPLGDGSKIRSSRFHTLAIDEFQDIDQDIVDSVILPFLNVKKNPVSGMLIAEGAPVSNKNKNRLVIGSTGKYQHDPAYQKYAFIKEKHESGDDAYFHSVINIDDLRTISGWVNEEIIEMQQQTMSPLRFLMENYGVWAQTGGGFFDALKCDNMKNLAVKFIDKPRGGCHYVIGVDPAKSSSNFVICMLEWNGTNADLVQINAYSREEVPLAVETIKHLQHKFDATVYMDARGGGIWVSDELMKTEVSSSFGEANLLSGIPMDKLVLVQTAHPLIDNMNWALKAGIENEIIRVPATTDEEFSSKASIALADRHAEEVNELIREIQSIVQKQLEREVQYTTDSKNALKDRYCAFMYAYWGIVENYMNNDFNEDDIVIIAV
jgi:hypothetical protein